MGVASFDSMGLMLPSSANFLIAYISCSTFLGMTARSVAGCAMIPITVLKTRFESGKYNYTRMSTALMEIYSREGVRGLSCGLVS